MQVKLGKIWQIEGVQVSIPEEIANEYVPAGIYHFITKGDDDSLMLLGHGKLFYIEDYEDDFEILVTDMDVKNRLDALIEAYTILNIQLISDGWSVDGKKYFNLNEFNNKLKSYINLREVLKSNPDDEALY